MPEPDNLVLHQLREMRAEIKSEFSAVRSEMMAEFAEVRSEMKSLRADVAADLHTLDAKVDRTRKELSEQIVGLRRAVVEYHSAVIGHGIIISDLEARLRRVEQHLNLSGSEAH
jgi:chromosome segregation ATPase